MGRHFVIGDIHGANRALQQCLTRSDFDFENDALIALGDVADGWPETFDCVETLLQIKNLKYILGNHDFWTLEWMESGVKEPIWMSQGGNATVQSYGKEIPGKHLEFFRNASMYEVKDNKLFVHAGIDPKIALEHQAPTIMLWDRNFANTAMRTNGENPEARLTAYEEVYIGHTPIPFDKPIKACEVWFMDTGAGWSGVLSMMDVDSKEVFSSDAVPSLYPGISGRKRR